MTNRFAVRWAQNPWLAALLLAAFCSRALIPAGFMPGNAGLALCSGHASIALALPAGAGAVAPGHRGAAHETGALCPFAAAAAAMAAPGAGDVALPLQPVSTEVAIASLAFLPRTPLLPTRLPRGPPTAV